MTDRILCWKDNCPSDSLLFDSDFRMKNWYQFAKNVGFAFSQTSENFELKRKTIQLTCFLHILHISGGSLEIWLKKILLITHGSVEKALNIF